MTSRRIVLQEYRTTQGVVLAPEQRDLLRALAPSVGVFRQDGGENIYDLTAGSWVGALSLPDLEIEIRPKIPIDRVMFLIAYTLDPKGWQKADFHFGSENALLESLIPGFIFQLKKALGRGLLQGYQSREEALATVRGRIRFEELIKKRYGQIPPIDVRFDDFTVDIEENRILKAAISKLSRIRFRSDWARGILRAYQALFEPITAVEYGPRHLPDFVFTRLTAHYRVAVELAKLIIRACSLELKEGRLVGSGFLVDMNVLFEDFVVAALREALGVSAREFPQGATGRRLRLDERGHITLKPDISLWEARGCVFVGDIKYKKINVEGIENPDIYQLLAYTVATELSCGLLIYAAGEEEPISHSVRSAGKLLEVVTLDLSASISDILLRVGSIASTIKRMRERAQRAPFAA